jgi:hypothetical protein
MTSRAFSDFLGDDQINFPAIFCSSDLGAGQTVIEEYLPYRKEIHVFPHGVLRRIEIDFEHFQCTREVKKVKEYGKYIDGYWVPSVRHIECPSPRSISKIQDSPHLLPPLPPSQIGYVEKNAYWK